MNPKKAFLYASASLFVLILTSSANALNIDEVKISDHLEEGTVARENLLITLSNVTQDYFTFTFPESAFDIVVQDASYPNVKGTMNISLNCKVCNLNISYSIRNAIKPGDNRQSIFSRTLNFPATPKNLEYSVYLPIGNVVGSRTTEPPIVPAPTEIATNGEHIIIVWRENSPTLPKRYFVSYSGHEYTETPINEIANELTEWPVWLIAAVFLILGAYAGFWYANVKLRRYTDADLPYVPSSLLSPDEKLFVYKLRENHAKMSQKEMAKALNWSKSKVSAIVSNLEYKKVVKRDKRGRNYDVTLIREIMDDKKRE